MSQQLPLYPPHQLSHKPAAAAEATTAAAAEAAADARHSKQAKMPVDVCAHDTDTQDASGACRAVAANPVAKGAQAYSTCLQRY